MISITVINGKQTGVSECLIKVNNDVNLLKHTSDLSLTDTHTHLTALCLGLPGWAGTRKVKPVWILLKQETVSSNGISWTICKSAPLSRQIATLAPHHSFFTGRVPFLMPNQQRQSTEGISLNIYDGQGAWLTSGITSNHVPHFWRK